MKKFLTIIFISLGLFCNAQTWETLDYNYDQPNLELNPLKGLTPLWGVSNDFPHSIRGKIVSLGEIMNGIDDFNWAIFDDFIDAQSSQGKFVKLQVNVDMGKPQAEVQLPAFLVDDVSHFYYTGGTNPGDNGISQLIVDYNDPEMMAAMLNFIQRFGERYNDEPGVFLVHYGLYGVFGEWDLGYGGNFVPNGEHWEMTIDNQLLITSAYQQYFDKKNLLARFPENVPDPQVVGYSDGLYFGASVSDQSNLQWFFHPKLVNSNADENWRRFPIGGEVDPDVQPILWENFPNTVIGLPGVEQETDEIFELTRPTFLFQDHIFNVITQQSHPTMWENALKATKKTGYTFHINEYYLSAANSKPAIEVNIQNVGLAPMYADWDVEFGYLDGNGEVVSLGTSSNWNLSVIQPDVENNYRSFISDISIPDGTHTIVLKVKNPLEATANSGSAHPVRFANTNQDIDKSGWLTLGDLTVSGGNAGVFPVAVTGLTVTPGSATMGVDSELQLTATVTPSNATNSTVTWVSSHPKTASVDENGLVVTNTLAGDVQIFAYTQDGGLESVINITVSASWTLPGQIQAEGYSAIFNAQLGQAPADEPGGGSVLGFIGDDTWMEYDVIVNQEAEFVVDFRASSFSGDGEINILDEAGTILGNVSFSPPTGNYDIYETYTSGVITLPAGEYTLRLDVVASSFNLNWIEFKLNPCPGQDPEIIGTDCDDGDPNTLNDIYISDCTCAGIPATEFTVIPALIEAEDYYNVFDAQVNPAPTGEPGGDILGFIGDDTYMEYAVTVNEETDFVVDLRASSPWGVGVINILNEVGDILGTVNLTPATDSYDIYDVFSSEAFTLPAGNHLIRLDVVTSALNLNWIEFRLGPCSGFDTGLINTPCDDGDPNTENDRYNSDCACVGMLVDAFTPIPAVIEAEDFYDVFNAQVNPVPAGETGGSVLGFIADNTWMDYAVSVSEEAEFIIDIRASSPFGVAEIDILNEEGASLGAIALSASTENYDTYSNYESNPFTLPAGYHRLRLDVVTSAFNLNWVDFKLNSPTSTSNLALKNQVSIYPNPVSDQLHIDISTANSKTSEIRLYDLQGRLLFRKQTAIARSVINVEPFKTSKMVFVQVINDNQQITEKIIIE